MSNCVRCGGEGFPRFVKANGGACFKCGATPYDVDPIEAEPTPERMTEAAAAARFGELWDTVQWFNRKQVASPAAVHQAGGLIIEILESQVADPVAIAEKLEHLGGLYFEQLPRCEEWKASAA